MMDPDFKAKWLEALRSGKYEQAQGTLHVDDQFCCLGVACDISGHGEWQRGSTHPDFFYFVVPEEDYRYGAHMPTTLRDRVFLRTLDMLELARLNDSGKTFSEIADWIEENL